MAFACTRWIAWFTLCVITGKTHSAHPTHIGGESNITINMVPRIAAAAAAVAGEVTLSLLGFVLCVFLGIQRPTFGRHSRHPSGEADCARGSCMPAKINPVRFWCTWFGRRGGGDCDSADTASTIIIDMRGSYAIASVTAKRKLSYPCSLLPAPARTRAWTRPPSNRTPRALKTPRTTR